MPADLYGYSMKDTLAEGENMCFDTVRMYNFENGLIMRGRKDLDHSMDEYEKKQK